MNSNHYSPKDDEQAQELDAFITNQLNGQSTKLPEALSPSRADLVIELVSQSKEILPEGSFVTALEAELLQRQTRFNSQKNDVFTSELPPAQAGAELLEASPANQRYSYSQTFHSLKQGFRSVKFANSLRLSQISLSAFALSVVLSLITVSTPSLRILALEIVQIFQRTRSDQVGQQTSSPNSQSSPLSQAESAALQAELRETKTVAKMEAERGIPLEEPDFIPVGFELKEVVSPFSEIVALNYKNPQTNARFVVVQQRLTHNQSPIVGPITLAPSNSNDSESQLSIMWSKEPIFDDDPALTGGSPIGVSAKTEPIQVGDVMGEYVEGTWAEVSSPNRGIQGMRWVDNTNFRQIQWREGEVLFQVVTPNGLSQDELMKIARSLR